MISPLVALVVAMSTVSAMPTELEKDQLAGKAAVCAENAIYSLHGKEVGTTIYACGSAFTLMSNNPGSANFRPGLSTRCTDPMTYSHLQTQVLETGTWWDKWARASGCNECQKSTDPCKKTMTWSDTTTETFSEGFDMNSKDSVLGAILGDAKFNLGYSWSHSIAKGGSQECIAPAGGLASIWVQNQKGWANSRTRTVTSTVGCGGNSVSYDDWSPIQHSDWALDGDTTRNLGCSTNQDSGC
ncbi:hypothetical protein K461DRAFT_312943 [Myriangium duriaei CBS 260.36]|uniref:Uncharacterized protein n=1 Tax=Myriangium duriaei CBS 260.36 TaxID=1168546 RepID=A0A9P4MHW1_9PEZI|nr:hypothetical protein K461DRAFT_312943 [Myriangium duriaei CBS 260.36]